MLDVCPISNVRTRAVASLAEHPLPALVAAGVACSVSTDDPAMFGTDLSADYAAALELGVSPAECFASGVRGALCNDGTRAMAGADRRRVRLVHGSAPSVQARGCGREIRSGRADRRTVAVIGGGVAGLTAAFLLKDAGLAVTVLEGSPRLGGKLSVSDVGGVAVDAGAEALLARRPEGVGLIGDLGLAGELQTPGTTAAGIWTRGQIRPLPRRQFMGVPADFDELAATGILSGDGLARARQDLSLPDSASGGDESVTSRVGGRFGPEVVDRLVEPLLGGVYAGRCEDLSFEATLPALRARRARARRSLTQAAASLLPPRRRACPPRPPAPPGAIAWPRACSPVTAPASSPGQSAPWRHPPRRRVFTTLTGGLGTLPAALAQCLGGRRPDQRDGARACQDRHRLAADRRLSPRA